MELMQVLTEASADYRDMASTGHCGLNGFNIAMAARMERMIERITHQEAAPEEAAHQEAAPDQEAAPA